MNLEGNLIEENVKVRWSLEHNPFVEKKMGYPDPKLYFDTKNPENKVGNIIESKKITKKYNIFPERCKLPLTSNAEMNLSQLQMELYKTEKKLQIARKKMGQKRTAIIEKWKNLEENEEKLKLEFKHFNKFIRENSEKRFRAEKKIEDDRKLEAKRQNGIDKFMKDINEMVRVTEAMDTHIKKFRLYQIFLQRVVELGAEFKTPTDILTRYIDLAGAKEYLLKRQRANMDILEHAKNRMMKLIEEKNFVIMGLNNQIANLQARYENANIKALESEELVTQIKNNAVKELGEIDTVKNSVWNVYVHMATSKKHPIKIKKDNVEEQMMYINRTLTELSKVNKLIKKRSNKVK